MTIAHYALIIMMSLLFAIGVISMMWENSKADGVLMYAAIVIAVIGLLAIFFGR